MGRKYRAGPQPLRSERGDELATLGDWRGACRFECGQRLDASVWKDGRVTPTARDA